MPQNSSTFHQLSGAAKLGQLSTEPARSPELTLSQAGAFLSSWERNQCSEKPQPEGQERLALQRAGVSSGRQRKEHTRGHHLQSPSWLEIHSGAAHPRPCLCCHTTQLQSKPSMGESPRVSCEMYLLCPNSPELNTEWCCLCSKPSFCTH